MLTVLTEGCHAPEPTFTNLMMVTLLKRYFQVP